MNSSRFESFNCFKNIKDYTKVICSSKILAPVFEPYRGCGNILGYHRVQDKINSEEYSSGLSVETSAFDQQILHVNNKHTVVSLSDLFHKLSQKDKSFKNLASITFDDGYKDNITNALPILEKYNCPATIFICKDFVTGKLVPWWYEIEAYAKIVHQLTIIWPGRNIPKTYYTNSQDTITSSLWEIDLIMRSLNHKEQQIVLNFLRKEFISEGNTDFRKNFSDLNLFMNENDLVQLSKHPLITIGAHTLTHPNLRNVSDSTLIEELSLSKKWLEEITGKSVDYFAYPFGGEKEVGKRETLATKECGFKAGFVTSYGHIPKTKDINFFALPRVVMNHYSNFSNFKWLLSGSAAAIKNRGSLTPSYLKNLS
jgi:peptidoglycan/xylan/chitin deacetylase (PgdA/CDA1 family)